MLKIPQDLYKRHDTPLKCVMCGIALQGKARKYCEKCRYTVRNLHSKRYYKNNRDDVRARQDATRAAKRRANGKWGGCFESGCAFFETCRHNIWQPEWIPYCFPVSRYFDFFARKYKQEAERLLREMA